MTEARIAADRAVDVRPASLGRMFLDRVATSSDAEAFRYRVDDEWRSLTWAQTAVRVEAIAAGLLALGVEREQRIGIASSTRLEWVLADTAVMCAGAATTTVYPSCTPEDVVYILTDSDTRVVFAENIVQAERVLQHRASLPMLLKVVVFDGAADDDLVMTLDELEALGRARLETHPSLVTDAVAATTPDDLATLMYTSGTTGRPKGVQLTHDCWVYEGVAIDALNIVDHRDVQYLWLPLSHSFGKVLLAAQMRIGFASAIDGDVDRLIDNLAVVRPTFMGAAPRIFEKVHARVVSMARADGGVKLKIFEWAFDVGKQMGAYRARGATPPRLLAAQHRVADKLVFSELQARFGGRLRYFISGSAALSSDIAEWFDAAGILILEGYGLTETSAFAFVNRPESYRFGTVGLPAPGTELSFDTDGEILIRGPGVMRGYVNMPAETTAALSADGWFRTGDIGTLEDGFLRITDRKKDLIKTSGGKYVAPQHIESLFKAICPYAGEVVVHGDRRNYVTALVTLDADALQTWAGHNNLGERSYAELVVSPEVRALVQGCVDELNAKLARWETVKKFQILPEELTVEEGELTPSMKVKRKAVEKKYAALLDSMYADRS
jgi:long-chain acyl-CoA synthetase